MTMVFPDLILKDLEMRRGSWIIQWAPSASTRAFITGAEEGLMQTDEQKAARRRGSELRKAGSHQKLEEARGGLPRAPRESTALPTPCLQPPALQNWGRLDFSCFKPPSGWYFNTAAPGNPHGRPAGGPDPWRRQLSTRGQGERVLCPGPPGGAWRPGPQVCARCSDSCGVSRWCHSAINCRCTDGELRKRG